MDIVTAIVVAAAITCLGMATIPQAHLATPVRRQSLVAREVARRHAQLRTARLHVDPRLFTAVCFVSPPLLLLGGMLLGSPVVAVAAGAGGFLVPRLYLDALVRAQHRRTEAEAPRLLQVLVASLTAGRTYLEALQEAHDRTGDRWLRDDLGHVISQFHLDVPLERSIAEIRDLSSGRNLRLIWDNLAICIAHRIPASRAKGLFVELSSTVQFNVQLEQEIRARTSGQRAQIWLLAAVVPGLFLYLRLVNPDFFVALDQTTVGRYLLLPTAVGLEIMGLALSFQVARVNP